ncbi:MAG: RraA family protein [Dehalococcoidia bacterium]
MPTAHPAALIEELKGITTPTIANAIELFDVRPRNLGFANGAIRCIFPDLPAMVGYACTATIKANAKPDDSARLPPQAFWEHVLSMPAPRVIVIQDEDEPAAVGSFWGEVNSSIFMALGAIGVVTDGGVRDLDEVHAMGFQFFAREVIVSHAYIHLTSVGKPVTVGGLTVAPGDLLHGDKHGVTQIPHELAAQIPDAVRRVEARERPIIDLCHAKDFSIDKLRELFGIVPAPAQAPGVRSEREYH